jgi:hypothetical protein
LEAGASLLPEDAARPWRKAVNESVDPSDIRSVVAGLDALLWQLTASVAMPGFTINRVVALAGILCADARTSLHGAVDPAALDALTYVPTLVGLLSIAVIVQPLDVLADVLFDATLREYVFDKLPVDHSGKITEDMVVDRITSRNDGQPMLSEEQLRALFRKVDTDADGYITLAEWRRDGHEVYNRYMQELQVRH